VPLFVIGGERLAGAQPDAVLRAAIETALRA